MIMHQEAFDELNVQTAEHTLTVLHEDGLYRHLRFAKGESSIWRIDIITWPGHLAISGDLQSYVFARTPDMMSFFRSEPGYINPIYWSEKIISDATPGRDAHRRYSPKLAVEFLQRTYGDEAADNDAPDTLWRSFETDLLPYTDHEDRFREALDDFYFEVNDGPVRTYKFEFFDTWELDFREYDFLFLVGLHAIVKIINLYNSGNE